MKKIILFFVTVLILFCHSLGIIHAFYDPTSVENNKFGIHLGSPADLEEAASLVNSSGGDWGYVTFVIQKGERNISHWQRVFDKARKLHLIPIVRIATKADGVNWEKPSFGDIDGWVNFLNSLNWVIKNRYIVIGNEPNHAKEWGGEINPEEYATYLKTFSEKLKNVSSDFFILPAGFDASAPNSKETIEESIYLRRMIEKEFNIFNYIDGWTSHSYPNPSFSGSEYGQGKGSVRTFEWEINYLRSLGLQKKLPIFITETGWAHKVSNQKSKLLNPNVLGNKFKYSFSNIWNSKNIVAVTPFIINYPDPPFDNFSWKDKSGIFYPFYYDVQNIIKINGKPVQETKGLIISIFMPPIQQSDTIFSGIILVKNTGQSIWNNDRINVISNDKSLEIISTSFNQIEPDNEGFIFFKAKINNENNIYISALNLSENSKVFAEDKIFHVFLFKPLNLKMQIEAIFAKIRHILFLRK